MAIELNMRKGMSAETPPPEAFAVSAASIQPKKFTWGGGGRETTYVGDRPQYLASAPMLPRSLLFPLGDLCLTLGICANAACSVWVRRHLIPSVTRRYPTRTAISSYGKRVEPSLPPWPDSLDLQRSSAD